MTAPLIVLNVVALSPYMLGEHTPNLNKLLKQGYAAQPLHVQFPAVTTTSQACMLTGKQPSEHGIVGNGWYFKDLAEVMFWKQANQLVQGDKVYDQLKAEQPNFKVSKLFWWYNMYANVDASITPRPHYLADGGKIFDCYSTPTGLHQQIENNIGTFPFFNFWGPKAGIGASRWIAQAAVEEFKLNKPNLQLVYLPHLDYCLQKLGPNHPDISKEIAAIDQVIGELMAGLAEFNPNYLIVSEYGITQVDKVVHINRLLRKQGWIKVRETAGQENLDCGASQVFAVSDHQCAHVYLNDKSLLAEVKSLLEQAHGIEQVLDKRQQTEMGLAHERSGDLVVISQANAWFSYYFWLDDNKAPDYARTVDIHRKPGYDPVEMYIDPKIRFPLFAVAKRILKKKLGFRMLMDVIPLDASLVNGSHGRITDDANQGAILIMPEWLQQKIGQQQYQITDVNQLIKQVLTAND
ncbi:alkaline phosphatase family protein [Catenovulum agarivorans]|uniref:alkaline phosphatase family protein n=1 Tax=Catenovulum agarivorans TaxID=1172192 RepID=UPI0002FC6A50|nr:nucleotide pyrophosphatase/phosphodiesterase family protein [Catenovulum agarivorans]